MILAGVLRPPSSRFFRGLLKLIRNAILFLQLTFSSQFFKERQMEPPHVKAGLTQQPGFLEIFYSAGMQRGGEPLKHAFLCQTHESGVLTSKFILL